MYAFHALGYKNELETDLSAKAMYVLALIEHTVTANARQFVPRYSSQYYYKNWVACTNPTFAARGRIKYRDCFGDPLLNENATSYLTEQG